jgi:hypothetical protein
MGAAAMRQVADWLAKLGLGQYAQRFAENDVSFSVLPDLTDQDLKDIGSRSVIAASCCVKSPTSTRRQRRLRPFHHR